MKDFYPPVITNLPVAHIPIEGVDARLLQSDNGQLCFFDLPAGKHIPPHSHGEQWGCVLDGQLELTIDGDTKTYGKGDTYHIPAGVVHEARFLTRVFVIDLFEDVDRYNTKG